MRLSYLSYPGMFVLALMLAGCGSTKTRVDTVEVDRLTGELMAATEAASAAEAQIADLTTQLATANDARTAADAMVADLTTQLATASDSDTMSQAQIADLTTQLATANDARTAADAMVADLTTRLQAAEDRADVLEQTATDRLDAEAAERRANAAIANAKKLGTALVAADPSDDATINEVTKISRGTSGPAKVVVARPGEKFTKVSPETTPSITGWQGETHVLTGENVADEKVTIYTDIRQAIAKKLILKDAELTEVATRIVPKRVVMPANDTMHYLEGQSIEATLSQATGTVEGMLTCTADAGCTQIEVPQGGGFATAIIGTAWEFVSNANADMAEDKDYLWFGYWVHAPENQNDSYGVSTFNGGSGLPDRGDAGSIETLDGTATYKGSAAGKYALREQQLNDRGQAEDLSGTFGRFTASAVLTADFAGTGDKGRGSNLTIRGAITNFRDGETNLGLKVNLMPADIGNDGVIGGVTPGVTAANIGLIVGGKGTWNGTFHGMSRATPTLGFPTGVSGDFNSHFGSGPTLGSVVGAFGATQSGGIANESSP